MRKGQDLGLEKKRNSCNHVANTRIFKQGRTTDGLRPVPSARSRPLRRSLRLKLKSSVPNDKGMPSIRQAVADSPVCPSPVGNK